MQDIVRLGPMPRSVHMQSAAPLMSVPAQRSNFVRACCSGDDRTDYCAVWLGPMRLSVSEQRAPLLTYMTTNSSTFSTACTRGCEQGRAGALTLTTASAFQFHTVQRQSQTNRDV